MLIWDTGSYEVLKADDLAGAIGAGEVKVVLRGRRLRGEWHLVRTRAGQNGKDEWLLFKARDRYARERGRAGAAGGRSRTRACAAPMPARPRAMAAGADHRAVLRPGLAVRVGVRRPALRSPRSPTVRWRSRRPSGRPGHPGGVRYVRPRWSTTSPAVRAFAGPARRRDRGPRPPRQTCAARPRRPSRKARAGVAGRMLPSRDARRDGAASALMPSRLPPALRPPATRGRACRRTAMPRTAAAHSARPWTPMLPRPPVRRSRLRARTRATATARAAAATPPDAADERPDAAPAGTVAYYAFDLLHYDDWDLRGAAAGGAQAVSCVRCCRPAPALLYADHVTASGEKPRRGGGRRRLSRADRQARREPLSTRHRASDWRRVPLQSVRRGARGGGARRPVGGRQPAAPEAATSSSATWARCSGPQEGYTKGDLLAFYEQVSDYLLPYLRDRPVHMNRFPDGVGGKSFFQRQAPAGIPDWVELVEVDERHTRQFICNDLRTLLYLVNLGSVELHPWLSRRGSLAVPDYAVLDLDAKETSFGNAVRVARTAGKVLRGIGLRPAIKTSGASGLHVYVRARQAVTATSRCGCSWRRWRAWWRANCPTSPAWNACRAGAAARCTSTSCRTAGAPRWCRRTWCGRCRGRGCRCRWNGTSWTATCTRAGSPSPAYRTC